MADLLVQASCCLGWCCLFGGGGTVLRCLVVVYILVGVVFGLTAVACRFMPSVRLLDCWLDVAWVG